MAMTVMCIAAGQTVILIPVLGASIGSIAGKFLSNFLQSKLRSESAGRVSEKIL
jgi:hypothetical protein